MADREKVISGLKCCIHTDGTECPNCTYWHNDDCVEMLVADVLSLLKEQEELINELLDLGYPHNFQHEAPWVVDYLYALTEIIKKAFKVKEGR